MSSLMKTTLLELIRRTSAFLPPDVQEVIDLKKNLEAKESKARFALETVSRNIGLAKARSLPICQDTGTITFYVHTPVSFNQMEFKKQAQEAVVNATELGYLRQNSVDSVSGKNSGNNLGPGAPVFHFEQWEHPEVEIKLVLKGGGCENVSAQFSLPAEFQGVRYGRDLKGVKACILEAVYQAQGKGCGPGFLGVCIGGDRTESYAHAKAQLLRSLEDHHPQEELALLESEVLQDANRLKIGPMGFGGEMTIGSCKIGALNRLPASFYVSIAYMCWAFRRRGVLTNPQGEVKEWLYTAPHEFSENTVYEESPALPLENGITLKTPVSEEQIRSLKVGDVVFIDGIVCTGRDAVHKYIHDGGSIPALHNQILYHCGPVVLEEKIHGETIYQVKAAGPTTSIREEPYEYDVIKEYGIKAVIGKGGMGKKTLAACKEFGAVYLHAIGGAAQVYAECVQRIKEVHLKEELGSPEAVWVMEVQGFPAVVTMDSHGASFHEIIQQSSQKALVSL